MLTTPDEAKRKICHLSQAHPTGLLCIAADCMAWRFGEWAQLAPVAGAAALPARIGNNDLTKPLRGYCGLAGRP